MPNAALRSAAPIPPDADAVTAVVVTYNSAPVLADCLAALVRDGARIVVVDNASSDGSVAIAHHYGAQVIVNAANEGFGRANNRGVAAAQTRYCLLVNPDAVLVPRALDRLLAAASLNPGFGMLAPHIVEPDGRLFWQGRSSLCESVVGDPLRRLRSDPRSPLPEGNCCAPFLSGACLLVQTDLFLNLGGFDPKIFLYFEDDDLCRRMRDNGRAMIHVHDAGVRHLRGRSSPRTPRDIWRMRWHFAWAQIHVAKKYGMANPTIGILVLNSLKFLASLLAFDRAKIARNAGMVAGALAHWRGKPAHRAGL